MRRYLIDEDTLKDLYDDSENYNAMICYGVNSWLGYDDCFRDYLFYDNDAKHFLESDDPWNDYLDTSFNDFKNKFEVIEDNE